MFLKLIAELRRRSISNAHNLCFIYAICRRRHLSSIFNIFCISQQLNHRHSTNHAIHPKLTLLRRQHIEKLRVEELGVGELGVGES